METVASRKGHRCLVATIIAAAALASSVGATDVPTRPNAAALRSNVRMADERTTAAVHRAVAGAFERLASPGCQQVFSDFRRPDGRTLDEVLAAGQWTGQDYLSLVLFYDGSRRVHCHLGDSYAITQPGSRAVFICTRKFLQKQEWNPTEAEALIIHEMLHSLGLGENPPTSVAITAGVLDRCG